MSRIARGVSSFRFFHPALCHGWYGRSLSRRPTRCDSRRSGPVRSGPQALADRADRVYVATRRASASFARPSRKTWWAFLRGRGEGRQLSSGEPRRRLNAIPYDGSYSGRLFAPALLDDDSTLASKSTDRCVNPTTDARSSPSSHLLVSTRLLVSWTSCLLLSTFLLLPDLPRLVSFSLTGISSFFSHGSYNTGPRKRSEERSDPGDRRHRNRNSSKRFRCSPSSLDAVSLRFLSVSRSLQSLAVCVLVALMRTVSVQGFQMDG